MTEHDLVGTEWFLLLREAFEQEFESLNQALRTQQPQLEDERRRLQENCRGWSASLADSALDPKIREIIQIDWAQALDRIHEIEALLAEAAACGRPVDEMLDVTAATIRINQLEQILKDGDATLMNLELGQYIDRIDCFDDGAVKMRTCRLGAFPTALKALLERFRDVSSAPSDEAVSTTVDKAKCKPRRRNKLRTDPFGADAIEQKNAVHFVADPHRFDALPTKWFCEDVMQIPEKTCWAKEHAVEVASLLASGKTVAELAKHFDKTPPTIRAASRRAAALSAPTPNTSEKTSEPQ